jgi:alkylation response protein AidB-like acyl-CoA dehydrogenase
VTLDLGLDDAQEAIVAAVSQFCREGGVEEVSRRGGAPPRELWSGLGELGVLGLASPEGEGGAAELVAALEALGSACFPGPLAASLFATQVLGPEERARVARGEAWVALGASPCFPWAPEADLFLEIDAGRVFHAHPRGPVKSLETLGGEPWGEVELARERELEGMERAVAVFHLSLAAYLAAAGRRLVEAASEHARSRRQFGRPIGDFQAVAHPLADCAIGLEAATALARLAAERLDAAEADAPAAAAAARLSAGRAALETAYVAHQVFGAVGVTLEGSVFHVSRRIRQLVSLLPGEDDAREALLGDLGLQRREAP